MTLVFPLALLIAGSALSQAAIVQTISLDLSPLNPGSTLSGTFTLSDSPAVGDTAPAVLAFSDPQNYAPTSLLTTITISDGTPTGFAVIFSTLQFTNLNGVAGLPNTRDVILTPFAFAMCDSFPCTAQGGFQDRSPAVFQSTYTIAPAPAVPEPSYAVPLLIATVVFGRRFVRTREE
jgi:hypothetical protein